MTGTDIMNKKECDKLGSTVTCICIIHKNFQCDILIVLIDFIYFKMSRG